MLAGILKTSPFLAIQTAGLYTARMIPWKRNLLIIWVSQFLSIAGFSLALPFSAYYLQELGITGEDNIKFWVGLAAAAPSIGLAIMAPVWGILADRYGRKLMMVRANFGATAILAAMAFSPSAHVFVLFRFMQGLLTGTMNAAMAFVASYSPESKQGTALGILSSAVFSGASAGPFIGGFLADAYGYQTTFLFSAAAIFLSTFLVIFGVKEKFVKPEREKTAVTLTLRERVRALGPALPIIILICAASFARRFDQPILPLYIQELYGREGVEKLAGIVFGVAALGAMAGGVLMGRLADRLSPPAVGKASAIAAGCFQLIMALVSRFIFIIPARFFMAFCAAGLDPVFLAWLSRVTPQKKRGMIFGWSVTARALGWTTTSLASAGTAMYFDVRTVFFIGPVFFVLLVPFVGWIARRVQNHRNRP